MVSSPLCKTVTSTNHDPHPTKLSRTLPPFSATISHYRFRSPISNHLSSPPDGALCHGMFLQGASWDLQGVCLERSKPKEMFVVMPVVLCKSVFTDKVETNGVWYCPVYKTEMRGPTYVFEAQLKSKSPGSRWVLAGVAMILDIV